MTSPIRTITIDHQPIELCKLLKIADLVAGGGEAKIVITQGYVTVNDITEYQKRKKVYHNDIIEFNGEAVKVILDEEKSTTKTATSNINQNTKMNAEIKDKKKAKVDKKTKQNVNLPKKRKSISF